VPDLTFGEHIEMDEHIFSYMGEGAVNIYAQIYLQAPAE